MLDKIGEAVLGSATGSLFGGINARRGARIDTAQKLGQESTLYARAMARGLTPQEYYGSPAPGNPSSSGAGQVIGNQAAQTSAQMMQLGQQARENQKDRDNAIEIEKIRAGVHERGQDMQFESALRDYYLRATEYFESKAPQIAANIEKTQRETAVLVNQVTTSSPRFVKMMKLLSMGPDNVYVAGVLEAAGVKTIDDIGKMTKEEQQKIFAAMLAGKSWIAREAAGYKGEIGDFVDLIIDTLMNQVEGVWNQIEPGIEANDSRETLGAPKPSSNRNRRGSGARM
jgi:hypothetical protein